MLITFVELWDSGLRRCVGGVKELVKVHILKSFLSAHGEI